MRSILRNRLVVTMLSWLIHKYCLFAYYTSRKNIENVEVLYKQFETGEPFFIAFWHSRLLFMPFFTKRPKDTYVIVSRHGDGEIISRTMDWFNINQVRGSTNRQKTNEKGSKNRGGSEVIRNTLKLIEQKKIIAITPDGPRGPRMRVKENFFAIVHKANIPVIPMTFSSSNAVVFNSWDRFMLPLPFAKTSVIIGDPITIPKKADDKTVKSTRKEIENQLNNITCQADEEVGMTPILPD